MSYEQTITFKCNNETCGLQYTIEEEMEMPPHWFGLQLAIADSEGMIPPHERDIFQHFCSQRCLVEYVASKIIKTRYLLASRKEPYEPDDDDAGDGDEGRPEEGEPHP